MNALWKPIESESRVLSLLAVLNALLFIVTAGAIVVLASRSYPVALAVVALVLEIVFYICLNMVNDKIVELRELIREGNKNAKESNERNKKWSGYVTAFSQALANENFEHAVYLLGLMDQEKDKGSDDMDLYFMMRTSIQAILLHVDPEDYLFTKHHELQVLMKHYSVEVPNRSFIKTLT